MAKKRKVRIFRVGGGANSTITTSGSEGTVVSDMPRGEEYVWDSGLEVHRGPQCPLALQAQRAMILVPATLLFLAREADVAGIDTEWLVKMKASRDGDMIIVEDEYCVPKQRATAASVETLEDCGNGWNTAVHKHPRGVTRFSETDYQNINQNNDVSILIESGRIAAATIRIQLPCGRYMILDVDTRNILVYLPDKNIRAVKERAKKLVEELKTKIESYHRYLGTTPSVSLQELYRRYGIY